MLIKGQGTSHKNMVGITIMRSCGNHSTCCI